MKQLERLSNGASKTEKISRVANLAVKNISCYKAGSWPGTEIKPVKACATDEYAFKVGSATAKMQDDSSCGPSYSGQSCTTRSRYLHALFSLGWPIITGRDLPCDLVAAASIGDLAPGRQSAATTVHLARANDV
jgi:hypothetical protein